MRMVVYDRLIFLILNRIIMFCLSRWNVIIPCKDLFASFQVA